MKLRHYSKTPLSLNDLIIRDQSKPAIKPRGLWLSDDAFDPNWYSWCRSENYSLDNLTCVHDVKLKPKANVLILRSAKDIDEFTRTWQDIDEEDVDRFSARPYRLYLPWATIRQQYDGLIITPYIWKRRLSHHCNWYYGWDVAGGCIWHPTAIRSITLREQTEIS
jgi:hypothetical protein